MENNDRSIYGKEHYRDRIFKGGTETKLLATNGQVEVLKQTISKDREFYVDSSEDWEEFEFLYLLEGKILHTKPGPERVLEPGAYISRNKSTEELWFRTKTDCTILWFSSEPVFHLRQKEVESFREEAEEIEDIEGMDNHSRNLERLSVQLGRRMGLSSQQLYNLHYAAFFHDIGKAKVPDEILEKQGKLTDEEWKIMKKHTLWGREMIEAKDFLAGAAEIVEQTHERVDGNGYPKGLEGNEISIESKIISVVDAYDAMRTDRVYRDALSEEEAIKELKENAGSQFDEEVVNTFLELIRENEPEDSSGEGGMVFDLERAHLQQRKYFLNLGEKVLSKADVDQILSDLARAVVDTSPFQRAIISLYTRPVDLNNLRKTKVEKFSYAGLTKEDEEKVQELGNQYPEVNLSKYDERFKLSNSYYIPHDADFSTEEKEGNIISSQKTEDEMDDWDPDDRLYVPLMKGDQVMGHISVDDPIDGKAPTTEKLEIIEALANLGSLAITKTQRIRELDRQKSKIRALHDVGYRFVQAESLNELFEETVELLEDNFDYDFCSILVYEEGRLANRVRKSNGNGESPFGSDSYTEIGEGIAGWVAENRESIMANDVRKDPRYLKGREDVESELTVPIEAEDDLLGVIDIQSRQKGKFSEEDTELLGTISSQLAIAMSNINRKKELKKQAVRDPLTGVFNRRYFSSVIEKEIERSHRYDHPLALLMTDINKFKNVNDTYSHLVGDEVLIEISRVIEDNIRDADTVVRYGGDEFLVLFPETGKKVRTVIDRIKSGLDRWNETNDLIDTELSLAMGLSFWFPDGGKTIEKAIKEADRRMYQKKDRA